MLVEGNVTGVTHDLALPATLPEPWNEHRNGLKKFLNRRICSRNIFQHSTLLPRVRRV